MIQRLERRDALRRTEGAATVTATINARPIKTNIGGREVATWAFGDRPSLGGIRAKVGDLVEATFENDLTSGNTLHWHGIAIRNDMDGVHDLTQAMVEPSTSFTYRFTVPDAGTHWFHPHMGLELDQGLYAPLIVEDPNDPVDTDVDVTLMLDDWLDGYGRTQQDVLKETRARRWSFGPHELVRWHGRYGRYGRYGRHGLDDGLERRCHVPASRHQRQAPAERESISVKAGKRVRIRLINAGSDTAYRVAVGGHRLTVTHADGFPVEPVEVDNVVLGMGERYDVVVTADAGSFRSLRCRKVRTILPPRRS
jgi:FtsP/CotA-like multicopper oxidase with cupredoxin domain